MLYQARIVDSYNVEIDRADCHQVSSNIEILLKMFTWRIWGLAKAESNQGYSINNNNNNNNNNNIEDKNK